MADLLGTDAASEDPAAEFLAREQDDLAEIGIEGEIDINQGTEDQFGGLEEEAVPDGEPPLVNGFADDVTGSDSGFDQTVTQIPQVVPTIPAQEPESLKKWREDKAELLEKMEEDEKEDQTKWLEKGKKDLEDWYTRYREQLDKVSNENKSAQEQFIEDMTSTKPGNEWERVARMCDFNPKNSKNTKDVGRMRSILLHLKQNPLVR